MKANTATASRDYETMMRCMDISSCDDDVDLGMGTGPAPRVKTPDEELKELASCFKCHCGHCWICENS